MKKTFSNSKYFYETQNNKIIVRKQFLSLANAISTIIITSMFISLLIYLIIYDSTIYKNNVHLILLTQVLLFLSFFTYSIISIIWKPIIIIFNDDHLVDYKKNIKILYDKVVKIDIESYQSSHGFRIGYQINHLSLFIEDSNSKKIRIIDIADKRNSEELKSFKLVLEKIISQHCINMENKNTASNKG